MSKYDWNGKTDGYDLIIVLVEKLKKNREKVPKEDLEGKYKNAYSKLKQDIAECAEWIIKDACMADIKIKRENIDEFVRRVNALVEEERKDGGLLKQASNDLFTSMSTNDFWHTACKLKDKVEAIAKELENETKESEG